jgi:hypothetical protein
METGIPIWKRVSPFLYGDPHFHVVILLWGGSSSSLSAAAAQRRWQWWWGDSATAVAAALGCGSLAAAQWRQQLGEDSFVAVAESLRRRLGTVVAATTAACQH